MFQRKTLFVKVWTFSSMCWKESRMLLVSLGAQVQAIFYDEKLLRKLAGSLLDLSPKMSQPQLLCLAKDGRLHSFMSLFNLEQFLIVSEAI